MELINHWTDWREVYGRQNSHQRKRIDELLQTRPALLYWGDSWFSTPLYRNLAKQSARNIEGLGMVIGKPGGLAAELFSKRELERVRKRIEANPFDTLIVSAGGNDSLSDRLDSVFKRWTTTPRNEPRITADAAYDMLVAADIFDDGNGGGILGRYEDLLQMATQVQANRPHFRVVGHGYAPLKRIGVAGDLDLASAGLVAFLKGEVGPWLWSVMQHVLPVDDKDEARRFAHRLLVDGFRGLVLEPLQIKYAGLFSYADFTNVQGTQEDAFWFDEIHPNEEGFARIAPLLNDRIRAALPDKKRWAVR